MRARRRRLDWRPSAERSARTSRARAGRVDRARGSARIRSRVAGPGRSIACRSWSRCGTPGWRPRRSAFYRGAAALMANDLGHPAAARRLRVQLGRRRAPGQLRWFRHARADAGLRPQRLRRDPSGALRVGRQAAGGQLRGGRPAPRFEPASVPVAGGGRGRVPQRDGRVRWQSRLDVWYARIQAEDIVKRLGCSRGSGAAGVVPAHLGQGRKKTSAQAMSRYTTDGTGRELQVISDPPFVEPIE